ARLARCLRRAGQSHGPHLRPAPHAARRTGWQSLHHQRSRPRLQLRRPGRAAIEEIVMTVLTAPTSVYAGGPFWERLWRLSGINFILFLVIAYVIYPHQVPVGTSADAVAAFYQEERVRILIAAVVSGMAVLNLLWFAAALRAALAEAGQEGWGAAVTTA